MVDLVQTTDDYSSEKLALHYYSDKIVLSATGRMYDDDGGSRLSLEQGEFELLKFRAEQDGDSLTIELRRDGGDYDGRPNVRDLEIVIHNWSAPVKTARFNGRTIRVAHSRRHNTLTARVDWDHSATKLEINPVEPIGKPVIYQVFTRLFGNKNTANKPWGTIEENGVGKFDDFTDAALEGIRELGTTHIWYTGVPHHAVVRDYTAYGISNDDPDVVKGRAGSPYAIKDYYNVNPDLAVDPARRLEEFEALIERTHDNGMKVIIDIVPNHVARGYESVSRPDGVADFGADDDTSAEWARDNNFYYVVGEDFHVPEPEGDYAPLGGEPHLLADGQFAESPAKWTGNGSRAAQPAFGDWFETVKMNYGVRPDGSYAFDRLPDEAGSWTLEQHSEFWRGKDVPDSWNKFRDIALYWLEKGVDGFRYDMAEMVPVEFWSYLNSSIKVVNPNTLLLAEVYSPALYRDYIYLGRMDYLYDKVGLYDTLKPIMQGKESTDAIAPIQAEVLDIEEHMLHFLENHDEQRIASPDFAGNADKAKPAMVVSALLSRSPTMLYFAQDVGEPGDGDAGFGDPTRTTIFDYWGVPSHQRWMNDGKFDGGVLTEAERELRDFYSRLLNFSATSVALNGDYAEIHSHNRQLENGYNDKLFSFVRWNDDERLIVVSNFSAEESIESLLTLPTDIVTEWHLDSGRYVLDEQLYGTNSGQLVVDDGTGTFSVSLEPLESVVYRVGRRDAHRFENVRSQFVAQRHVDVWLPDGYEDSHEPYSVLYAHDGQNIFIPWQVGYHPIDWGIDEAVQQLMDKGAIRNTIVVGVWNTPNRIAEYLPWEAWKFAPDYRDAISSYMDNEPVSREYLEFLVEELKPFIDQTYRTKPGREDTFLLGSSMGGLISLYGLISYPEIFGGAACISTHWPSTMMIEHPEQNEPFLDFLRESIPPPDKHRLYFDFGTAELDAQYEPHQRVVDDVMHELGYEPGALWQSRKFEGAGHNEPAWRERVHIPLKFLLGTDNNKE